MLDERAATWRIYLPHEATANILVVGVNLGTAIGLSRAGGKVTLLSQAGNRNERTAIPEQLRERITISTQSDLVKGAYTLVVIGAANAYFSLAERLVEEYLAPVGSFVCLRYCGCRLSRRSISVLGFGNIADIAAIPWKRARVLFPVQPEVLREKGLTFHQPGRKIGQAWVQALRLISGTGWLTPLKYAGLMIAHRNGHGSKTTTLKSWFAAQLELPVIDLVAYLGSDTERRKITVLAVCADGFPDVIAKIADTKAAETAIRQESDTLQQLARTPLSEQVPEILFQDRYLDGSLIHVQSTLDGDSDMQLHELLDAHFDFLAGLSKMGRHTGSVRRSRLWCIVTERLGRQAGKNRPPSIKAILRWMESAYPDAEAIFHLTHGDFAPWNVRMAGKKIRVFDWEESSPDGLAGSDAIHFLYVRAAFVSGKWPKAERLMQEIEFALRRLEQAEDMHIDFRITLGFWMLSEYVRRPTARLLELAEVLAREIH